MTVVSESDDHVSLPESVKTRFFFGAATYCVCPFQAKIYISANIVSKSRAIIC